MLHQRSLIIGRDDDVADELRAALKLVRPMLPVVRLRDYPTPTELEALLDVQKPTMILMSVEALDESLPLARRIRRAAPWCQVMAFSRTAGRQVLLELMRAGIDEWLGYPFGAEEVKSALERTDQFLAENPPQYKRSGHVFSFFPAKPGSGASTVAMNTAAAVARLSGSQTALIDLDLHHGVLDFLLKLGEGPSVCHALENSERLDGDVWEKIAAHFGDLHVLRSGASEQQHGPAPGQVEALLSFAERVYPVTCVDLAGRFDEASVAAFEHSALVFQVCSTDFASLHLARRNMEAFGKFRLRHKVRTIVNRAIYRNGLNREGVEEILGTEAFACIPSSYVEIQSAIADGRLPDAKSPLTAHFDRLARQVLGVHEEESLGTAERSFLRMPALRSAVSTLKQRMSDRKLPAELAPAGVPAGD